MHRPSFRSSHPAWLLAALAAFSAVRGDVLDVPDGFGYRFQEGVSAPGGLAVLPDGGIARFQGESVVVDPADGSAQRVLLTLDDPLVYGTFLRLAPDGGSLWFGVNYQSASGSPHDIYRISLEPAEPARFEVVEIVRFNYDLVFDGDGRPFLSTSELGPQMIALLDGDPSTPADPVVVNIPGISGPLAFRDGKLYYATALLPPLPEGTWNRIVYFTVEQLEAGIGEGVAIEWNEWIASNESQVVAGEIPDTYFNLVFVGDDLLASGAARIDRIAPGKVPELFAGVIAGEGGYPWVSYLDYRPGRKSFDAGNGVPGGTLFASVTDFTTYNGLAAVTPELWFLRGRINGDGDLDISDAIALLGFLFLGGDAPDPIEAGDANDDNAVDIADPIFLLTFLFGSGSTPPEPFLERGPDPTP
jgi:hypothetical protein